MSVPASQEPPTPPADALRSADLSDLLGHVHTCWDNERRSLSRQLHDSLGSSLTALTMHLGLLMQKLPPEPALQDRAGHMKKLLGQIVETNRQMQLKLWNDKLEFLGIKAAITELVSEFGTAHALTARISLPDEDDAYPREHNVALLRTVEEGLRNVLAHARASEVDVILDDDGDDVMLTVRDNGVGPRPEPHERTCHGLRLLRERAAYLGGSMRVSAAPEGGTILTVSLPRKARTALENT